MIALWMVLLLPLSGMLLLALVGHHRQAGWLNVFINATSLAAALWLAWIVLHQGPLLSPGKLLYIDAFNVYLVALTALVGFTTAIFSRPYMQHEVETRQIGKGRMRLYHSMYQGFMFAMMAALTTNNVGILWVAMEGATLATVLLVSLYRTPEAVEAAWKYFILCGVGIAQVIGFMSIENGLFFAAVSATYGMPMVVELGIAFDVLVAAVLFGVFFFQMRESIDSLDVDRLNRLQEMDEPPLPESPERES